MNQFEDMVIWQKAKALSVDVYKTFSKSRDFAFRDQIQRASVSIMNNIAEGFERKGMKEFYHFLSIAKGSAGEVRSMLALALELEYITGKQHQDLSEYALELSRMIAGFMKRLRE